MREPLRPIWWDGSALQLLDQTLLPGELVWLQPTTLEEILLAIKELKVRGAPAIGIAGAFGLYLGMKREEGLPVPEFLHRLEEAGALLKASRPTAVNLAWAVDRTTRRIRVLAEEGASSPALVQALLVEACTLRDEDEAMCRSIGIYGAELLRGFTAVLTHCNAGTIATARYGTALSPIYRLAEEGRLLRVYADETRPLLQGARLTAFELRQAGIPVTLITDSMAASVMAGGRVQAVIVGADRIAANGDTANKIGTYGLAILAKEHGIPFYVAAPSSTFDPSLNDGSLIPIEERGREEVLEWGGRLIAPSDVDVYNPAFDVTPARYITGIITEKGVLQPPFRDSIASLTIRPGDE